MSLQVWMPLKGNLDNHGLANITVTNNGATVNDNGKIGKCYSFTSNPITLSNLLNPTSISVAFWMKRTADTNTRQFMFTAWAGVTCELTTGGSPTFAVYRDGYPTIYGDPITVSSGWVHYCGTFSPNEGMKLYINGVQVASNSNTTAIAWGTTSGKIGKYGDYASASMLMNDFRIYDHALTSFEVKRIYQEFNQQGSLQIWLQLTKDLTNRGLLDAQIQDAGSATQYSDGKLCNCYAPKGLIISNLGDLKVYPMTIAFWCKTTNTGTPSWEQIVMIDDTSNTQIHGIYVADASRLKYEYNPSVNAYNVNPKEWHHYTYVINNGDSKVYVDGVLNSSSAESITADVVGRFRIGSSGTIRLNDLRIYDRALSATEAHKLSQGLVLHYPLDDGGFGNANYVLGTMESSSTNGKIYSFSSVIPSGTQVTISCWIDADNIIMSGSKRIGLSSSMSKSDGSGTYWFEAWISYGNGLISDNGSFHGYVSYTTTIPGNMSNIGTYIQTLSSGTVCISKVKVEVGDKRTNWVPNSSDTLYTSLGIDDTVEYDCSGYGNHGIKYGTFVSNLNTFRYSTSLAFNGSDNSIKIPFNDMIKGTDYTVSVWIYKTSIGSKGYQTILGGPGGFELEARNGSGTDPLFVLWNWGKGTATYEFNKWTHFCFVHTSSDCKMYVNGELCVTGSIQTVPSGNYFIGAWNSSSQQNFEGSMSDFRIYATALSDDDILDLYNVGMYVDKSQNIHTYNLQEIDTTTIEKSGILNAKDEFTEYDDIGFYKSGLITANQFYEY